MNLIDVSRSRSVERTGRAAVRLFTLVVIGGVAGLAQTAGTTPQADRERPRDEQSRAAEVRKLESVSWNPVTRELTWVVSTAKPAAPEDASKNTYVIRMDQALMKFEGEGRRFDPEEARNVQTLLNVLSRYAVESTLWWENGQGIKVNDRPPGLRADAAASSQKPPRD